MIVVMGKFLVRNLMVGILAVRMEMW